MRNTILLIFICLVISCENPSQNQAETLELVDNLEIKEIYQADQADRQTENIDWFEVSKRDSLRKARVYELLDSGKVRTSKDYYNAAMVFQHGGDTVASGMAVKMMKKAIQLDSTTNKWLLAAAIDRDLMRKGQPQIYGTQYTKSSLDEPWQIYNLDSTKITDEERREYGVETLTEQKEKLKMMNKKKLSELYFSGKSIKEVTEIIRTSDVDNSEYDLSENGLNMFGYQLMAAGKNEEALQIFKLNTELNPQGFNTYDSYGECLVKLGYVEKGIEAYKKSLELNPKNDNAKKVLAELKVK